MLVQSPYYILQKCASKCTDILFNKDQNEDEKVNVDCFTFGRRGARA